MVGVCTMGEGFNIDRERREVEEALVKIAETDEALSAHLRSEVCSLPGLFPLVCSEPIC
jgi:hypothetical protein